MNSAELVSATGTAERYVREWLASQAASGYVEYDAASGKFSMLPEQAMALADQDSLVFLGAVGNVIAAAFLDEPKITEAFKTGKGVGWNRRSECLFCGTARFFRTGYMHHLVQEWLPALDGVVDKLEARRQGGGCRLRPRRLDAADGRGLPELALLRLRLSRGPRSRRARKAATEAKLGDRSRLCGSFGQIYPAEGYDFVCFFDCLHDMGDPVGA